MAAPEPADDWEDTETSPDLAEASCAEAEGDRSPEARIKCEPNVLLRFFKLLGPGLITGASDDDPTAIGTYSAGGAAFGYATLWTTLLTVPMMAVAQYMSAKIALVTGVGLGTVLREHYPRPVAYAALGGLVVANAIMAGADIGAIAIAINLLVPVPPTIIVAPIALAMLAALIWGSYGLIANVFKWLALTLFAYVGAALLARPDPMEVLRGTFIPTLRSDRAFLSVLVAMLGTNISPSLFFWQASQELEEHPRQQRRGRGRRPTSGEQLKYVEWDTNIGMAFSNAVLYFLNLAAAATLFAAGQHNVQTATDAAAALRPLLGDLATILFAIGLLGSGFLAVPIFAASSAYAVSEAFGWQRGLDQPLGRGWKFYAVVAVSLMGGMLINFLGISFMDTLVWAAAISGVLAAPLLLLIMLVANNRNVMGDHVNGLGANVLGWLTTAAMAAAAVGLFAFGMS